MKNIVDNKRIILPRCSFCGKIGCEAHNKYTDRCVECGKRYAKFSSYSSLQRSNPNTKRGRLLEEIIAEYIELRDAGYNVPRCFRNKNIGGFNVY